MSSIRPPTRNSPAPVSVSKQSADSNSLQYSCSSLSSSIRSSTLSGTYILSRTQAEVGDAKNASAYHYSMDGTAQESPTHTIAYFPPSPSASTLSVTTYDSRYSAADPLDGELVDGREKPLPDREAEAQRLYTADDCAIPQLLRPYCGAEPTDPPLRPSDPRTFRYLFPSWDGLCIRHDDTTPDGNMNLRVDTVALGLGGSSREGRDGPVTVQLFHLRMHDLVERHFSLRRYCRDSGREVCFSKRAYASASSGASRGGIQQSVSSALRHVRAPFHRPRALSLSCFSRKSSSSLSARRRPSTASAMTATSSASSTGRYTDGSDGQRSARLPAVKSSPSSVVLAPTNRIKIEFGNYARVEVCRRGSKRYGFEWWGHTYAWKRVVNKQLNTFSFHLRRGDKRGVLAHIEQERQSPSQIEAEKRAGGWVPPCCMWFQWSVITGPRDVAEIFVATGLVALVDDCIRQEWQSTTKRTRKRNRSNPSPAPPRSDETHFGVGSEPSSFRRGGLFGRCRRRQTGGEPFRFGREMSLY
ncbi:hypothetical protein E4U41_006584 [Claviceps citrina]|nr:hypothetical protein E4U41_006584 [Claviceps citrina]